MRRLIGAATALLIATVVSTASATQVPWVNGATRSCSYTRAKFERDLRYAYHGTAMPPRGSVIALHRLSRCHRRLGLTALITGGVTATVLRPHADALRIWTRTRRRWQARRRAAIAEADSVFTKAWDDPTVLCVLRTETTSTPSDMAVTRENSSGHMGAAQWAYGTWNSQVQQLGLIGYPSSPLEATAEQQLTVLEGALAAGDGSSWFPYDGC